MSGSSLIRSRFTSTAYTYMDGKTSISLVNFFVFNSSFGPKEGQELERILFYHPDEEEEDIKIRTMGLCEAVIKFTQTFTDGPMQSVHTQKRRQLFLEPETDFCIVMTVRVPCLSKVKDNQACLEYQEEDVQDSVYLSVLQLAYDMYKFFMGTFVSSMASEGVEGLKKRLEHFFPRYLLTLRLATSDLLDVFGGIHFLPLDKNTYLRVQCFLNLLESTFPQLHHTAFLYNHQLVWSGLEQEDIRILFRYITTVLLPDTAEHELEEGRRKSTVKQYSRFIIGPTDLSEDGKVGKLPKAYICHNDKGCKECHLLVYKSLSAVICLLVDGSLSLDMEFFRKLDKFLGVRMHDLASDISDQYTRTPALSNEVQFKYIFFNHMNLAQKASIHTDAKSSIPISVLKLTADLHQDMNSVTAVDDGETIVKTGSDYWLVAKKCDQREVYIILNQKNANLIEINEEVKRLCLAQFSSIWFLD